MDAEQKYIFDLQGYITLKNVVADEVVRACNKVLDRFETMDEDAYPSPLRLGDQRTEKNLYISNILEGDEIFRALIDIPEVLDVIAEVTGGPYRLNHTYTIYRWGGGFTGLHMHGTPIIAKCQYHCRNGQMVSTLTKAVFPLLDCAEEDGCFAEEQLSPSLGKSSRRKSSIKGRRGGSRRRDYIYRGADTRVIGQYFRSPAQEPILLL